MNKLKTTLVLLGITSFSLCFSQTIEQDFSHLDKNQDGQIDKTEFESTPPPPSSRAATSKKEAQKSSGKLESSQEKAAPTPPSPPLSFESIDANNDGIIDMDEFTLNHTAIRKRPGSQVNRRD